jgi:hypothetical protein
MNFTLGGIGRLFIRPSCLRRCYHCNLLTAAAMPMRASDASRHRQHRHPVLRWQPAFTKVGLPVKVKTTNAISPQPVNENFFNLTWGEEVCSNGKPTSSGSNRADGSMPSSWL